MGIKKWNADKMFEKGYAYENKGKNLELKIVKGQFGGREVLVWDFKNHKSISRRKFENYKQALAYSKRYMKKN